MHWKKRNAWVQLRLRQSPAQQQLAAGIRHLQQREAQRARLQAQPTLRPLRLQALEAPLTPTPKEPWT